MFPSPQIAAFMPAADVSWRHFPRIVNFIIILADITLAAFNFVFVCILLSALRDAIKTGAVFMKGKRYDTNWIQLYVVIWALMELTTGFSVIVMRVMAFYRYNYLDAEKSKTLYYLWLPRLKFFVAPCGYIIFLATAGFLSQYFYKNIPSDGIIVQGLLNAVGAFFGLVCWCASLLAVGYGRMGFVDDNGWPRYFLNTILVILMIPFVVLTLVGNSLSTLFEDAVYSSPRVEIVVDTIRTPEFRLAAYFLPLFGMVDSVLALTVHCLIRPNWLPTACDSLGLAKDLGLAWVIIKSMQLFITFILPLIKVLVSGRSSQFMDLLGDYSAVLSNTLALVQLHIEVTLSKTRYNWLTNSISNVTEALQSIGENTSRKRDLDQRLTRTTLEQTEAKQALDDATKALIELTAKEADLNKSLEDHLDKVAWILFDYDDDIDAHRPEEVGVAI